MSRMSLILILSYRFKEVTKCNVLHCLEILRFAYLWNQIFDRDGVWILNGQVDYIENSKLTIVDM